MTKKHAFRKLMEKFCVMNGQIINNPSSVNQKEKNC